MSTELLISICGVLVILLGVSESLPFVKAIKANSWGQLLIAVIRVVAAQKKR